MREEELDRELLERIGKTLDESVATMDGETVQRLRRIRLAALEGAPLSRPSLFPLRWVTAGGLATAAVLVVGVSVWLSASRSSLPVKHVEDLEIMTAQEHLELYEDLEFYRWLAEK